LERANIETDEDVNRLISIAAAGAIIAFVFPLAPAADMAAAKQNYDTFCAKCHGPHGKGDGSAGATLATHPAHFSDCAMMGKMSDETMFNVIKHGGGATGRSRDMPAWSSGFEARARRPRRVAGDHSSSGRTRQPPLH
jgi:mono/diheme cytochrome c family protein